MRLKYLFTLALLTIISQVFAQTGTIRGFVYDKETGEPIIFTNVYIDGTTQGAATDVNGYYSITKVKAGTYKLACSALGYEKLTKEVTVESGKIETVKLYLSPSALEIDEVVISSDKREAMTEVKWITVQL